MSFDDIVFPNEKISDDEPPPTDLFYPIRTLLSKNLIDTVKFAVAVGLGSAILFGFIALLVARRGSETLQEFFTILLPWFSSSPFAAGFLWSFLLGFVFGLIVGRVYNGLVRSSYLDRDSWERLS